LAREGAATETGSQPTSRNFKARWKFLRGEFTMRSAKLEIYKMLMALSTYYDKPMNEAQIEIYTEFLEKRNMGDVKAAIAKHIEISNFFPKVSEILKWIPAEMTPAIESTATLQAHHVLQCMRTYGSRHEPVWDDQNTFLLMNSRWKWSSLCETQKESDNNWFVKEFVAAYAALIDSRFDDANLKIEQSHAGRDVAKIASGLFKRIE